MCTLYSYDVPGVRLVHHSVGQIDVIGALVAFFEGLLSRFGLDVQKFDVHQVPDIQGLELGLKIVHSSNTQFFIAKLSYLINFTISIIIVRFLFESFLRFIDPHNFTNPACRSQTLFLVTSMFPVPGTRGKLMRLVAFFSSVRISIISSGKAGIDVVHGNREVVSASVKASVRVKSRKHFFG